MLFFLVSLVLRADESLEKLAPLLDDISGEFIQNHTEVLGSDFMEGRATGSRGERLAADYIRSKLKEYNVEPAVGRRSYFQNIPLHGSTPLSSSRFTLHCQGKTVNFELAKDYVLYNTGAQTFLPKPLPLVFVGHGIVAPEFDYNDYQNVDVTDKIVVYLSGEPVSDDPAYFDGPHPTIYSYAESKERLAISRGARGCLLIPHPDEMLTSWDEVRREFLFEDVRLAYSVTDIFSAMINPDTAALLFDGAEHSLESVFQWRREHIMLSFELPIRISFRGQFEERDFFSRNILAEVRGTDSSLRDSYLILSAHYDHLGIGAPVCNDSIYNGVVDNAIGTAALLEIARALQKSPPKRSVLFMFLTGEEKGLLGSTYYIDNPVIPHFKTIANINIDGLAIFDTFRDIIGFGTDMSTLGDVLHSTATLFGVSLSRLPRDFSRTESFARSDQIVFAKAGIPAALVMEGVLFDHLSASEGIQKHIKWMQNIYHSPFDDLTQPIHWSAAEQHCQLLLAFAWKLANAATAPTWLPGTPYVTTRLQSIAEKK
ncbi:M28 family peptidase [candidate division KSB1 bacterium]|nr:M28 family peptidase [candidate division KSB1 bacterium]